MRGSETREPDGPELTRRSVRVLLRAASARAAAADRCLLEAQYEAAQAEAELQAVRHLVSVVKGGGG